ncbi:D-xylulose kinase A [Cladophialophora carrionii CBS 160.54]|uniref:Xylulose kinase n=1 Tax=Cladophialophora carrionii CBS 160.54 TaxID=1279043 RepID=V9DJ15_9EURO|nr:D-xylulose kinase A [Cladophialophora carrionii CBS 160.54]ETI25917.1 D-xylulose kinase A [Cladophialophora carrionii CBS 160.54]
MTSSGPLYLGFDLSTQQLKGLVVDSSLKKIHEAKFDFDADSKGFNVTKGVLVNEAEHEVFAPVAMWLQAIDTVLARLKDDGLDFSRVKGISGSGMQHGSVFWNADAEQLLSQLDSSRTLESQLDRAFAHPFSPNWQDASTQKECDEFDAILGNEAQLANVTGSKAHHRFTGPQILRFQRKYPDKYIKTHRITLVSSWIATILLGKFAPFDISDVCGMNLWDIKAGNWHQKLLELTAGPSGVEALKKKLGDVPEDGGIHLGTISQYFVKRHGFSNDCTIIASTGDNPSTILALPLRDNDAMVSLGTSTTFLMSTSQYKPDPATHFFNHPTTPGLYMFMLCYKNGGLAREKVRDAINDKLGKEKNSWQEFDNHLLETPPLAQSDDKDPMHLGLYFPRPEIIPNLPVGEWHFSYNASTDDLQPEQSVPQPPEQDARVIVESQFLSLRLRSRELVSSPASGLPAQPRRIYLVGGGSRNKAIAKVAGQVLGGSEGVFKLDVGENACALGAAYKAVWAVERHKGETFEELIGKRWREEEFVEKIADGYNEEVWHRYARALQGFEAMELRLLAEHDRK